MAEMISWLASTLHRFAALLLVWRTPAATEESSRSTSRRRQRKSKQPIADDLNLACRFTHFENILASLPKCHRLVKRLRKLDPDAYAYHRQVGARVLPNSGRARADKVDPAIVHDLPARGMILMSMGGTISDDGSLTCPMLLYFNKVKTSMWASAGEVFEVTVSYFDPEKDDKGIAVGWFHAVVADGHARAVPTPTCYHQTIRHKDKLRHNSTNTTTITHHGFGFPPWLRSLHKDRERHFNENATLDEFGGHLLHLAMNFSAMGRHDWQFSVLAEKGGVAVRFDLDITSPKTFFADRALDAASDGRRKRIVHWVTPHERIRSDGQRTLVRGHFRGSDSFLWKGFRIRVLMPDNPLDDRAFNVPSVYTDEVDDHSDMLDPKGVGSVVREHMLRHGPRSAWSDRMRAGATPTTHELPNPDEDGRNP